MSNTTLAAALAALSIGAAAAGPAFAQDAGDRTTDQYSCRDIMRDAGAQRDIAIAFIHGYLLGKANATRFNVKLLQKQTDAFIDYCLDHPHDKAMDAMMKVKS